MKRIDNYISSIYKDFDSNDTDVKDLKDEMKIHLYEKVNEYKKLGKNENESIDLAIKEFGYNENTKIEMSDILNKKNKFMKYLLISSITLFFIGIVIIGLSIYFYNVEVDEYESYRVTNGDDIMQNKIYELIKDKKIISNEDKKTFDRVLNEYNNSNNFGMYYIAIKRDGKIFYEYDISDNPLVILNDGGGEVAYGEEGWRIVHKTTEEEHQKLRQYREHLLGISRASNKIHNKLEKIAFQILFVSWIFIIIYLLQKLYYEKKLILRYIILFSVETLAIFTTIKSL